MTAATFKSKWLPLLLGAAVFLLLLYLPAESPRLTASMTEALALARWYAREHIVFCLVPAFFIAGAIAAFISKQAVMRYLGPAAPKALAYAVASVSGSILAVCSCTVLPLFAGIWRMGAGLGPACAFLYAAPAINILAIILTARVLGAELGIARAVGAIVFSIVIGLVMHLLFRREEAERIEAAQAADDDETGRPLWQECLFFALLVGVLIFATWGTPRAGDAGVYALVGAAKWWLVGVCALGLAGFLITVLQVPAGKIVLTALATVATWIVALVALPDSLTQAPEALPYLSMAPFAVAAVGLTIAIATTPATQEWFDQTAFFAKQMLPLLLIGVLVAGLLLGRPGHEGLIPSDWIASQVGGNSLQANLFASVVGAFMYFATLTEIPILQGLLGAGMGQGPALALLLAGPALSLPNMLVIHGILGTRKTLAFVTLVVILATLSGWCFGLMQAVPQ
ncbi:MAG: permease [Phycisphaerales bacterium JB038]